MFKKILMPIDLQETELAERTVEIAIDEARKHGAELHVLTVLQGFGMPLVATFFPENLLKKAVEGVAKELKKFVSERIPDDVKAYPIIAEGNPAEQILKQSDKLDIDLIIIPSHTQSSREVLLVGSHAGKVVDQAKCSVMVVKLSDD
jgi:nucleotide-binding universal stress UspA family protein